MLEYFTYPESIIWYIITCTLLNQDHCSSGYKSFNFYISSHQIQLQKSKQTHTDAQWHYNQKETSNPRLGISLMFNYKLFFFLVNETQLNYIFFTYRVPFLIIYMSMVTNYHIKPLNYIKLPFFFFYNITVLSTNFFEYNAKFWRA